MASILELGQDTSLEFEAFRHSGVVKVCRRDSRSLAVCPKFVDFFPHSEMPAGVSAFRLSLQADKLFAISLALRSRTVLVALWAVSSVLQVQVLDRLCIFEAPSLVSLARELLVMSHLPVFRGMRGAELGTTGGGRLREPWSKEPGC